MDRVMKVSQMILWYLDVAYMPIMMGGVSVYSAVYSYLAMQGPGSETTGLCQVTLDTERTSQYYG